MAHGGKRSGAGRPKGSKSPSTLSKEMAREALRQIILKNLQPLVKAQLANAKGLQYLVVRDKKTGKFVRVGEAMARLARGEELIEVWEKDPSIQAFTDLMNRALDKPAEQPQELKLSGEIDIGARLQAQRERLRKATVKAGS